MIYGEATRLQLHSTAPAQSPPDSTQSVGHCNLHIIAAWACLGKGHGQGCICRCEWERGGKGEGGVFAGSFLQVVVSRIQMMALLWHVSTLAPAPSIFVGTLRGNKSESQLNRNLANMNPFKGKDPLRMRSEAAPLSELAWRRTAAP